MPNSTLQCEIDQVVGEYMGVSLIPGRRQSWFDKTPARAAFFALAVMSIVFLLPIWLIESRWWTTVLSLSVWGALYFSWAVLIARLATTSMKSILLDEVQPLMSESQKAHVCNALKNRFSRRRILSVSLGVGALATGASLLALKSTIISTPQLALIALEFCVLYVTAAQATYAACFYRTFAEAVDNEPQTLGPLVPSTSPIILAMRSVGAVVLLFWFGIMLAVLTLMAFSADLKRFVLIVVPTASFFSFLLGSAVFIAAEAILRRACRRAAVDMRLKLDVEARILINKLEKVEDSTLERLERLTKVSSAAAAIDTKGILLVIVSIVTPFATPMVALLIHFLKQ